MSRQMRLDLSLSHSPGLQKLGATQDHSLLYWLEHSPSPNALVYGQSLEGVGYYLEATAQSALELGFQPHYTPKLETLLEENLETLEQGVYILGGVETLRAQPELQKKLFDVHNRIVSEGGKVLYGASSHPIHWDELLPDLKTRLSQGLAVSLDVVSDSSLELILEQYMKSRGWSFHHRIPSYLLQTHSRDLVKLLTLLDAMEAQFMGRLTLPALRSFLASYQGPSVSSHLF